MLTLSFLNSLCRSVYRIKRWSHDSATADIYFSMHRIAATCGLSPAPVGPDHHTDFFPTHYIGNDEFNSLLRLVKRHDP